MLMVRGYRGRADARWSRLLLCNEFDVQNATGQSKKYFLGNDGGDDGGPSVAEFGDGGVRTRGGIVGCGDGGDCVAPPKRYPICKMPQGSRRNSF